MQHPEEYQASLLGLMFAKTWLPLAFALLVLEVLLLALQLYHLLLFFACQSSSHP